MNTPAPSTASPSGWERFTRASTATFRRYAEWLVGISWKKFFLLSVLLLIASGILTDIPPFSWEVSRTVRPAPEGGRSTAKPSRRAERLKQEIEERVGNVEIKIDDSGIRILRKRDTPATASEPGAGVKPPASEPSSPVPPASDTPEAPAPTAPGEAPRAKQGGRIEIGPEGVQIDLPPGKMSDDIRAAVQEARDSLREAIEEEVARETRRPRVHVVRFGEFLPQLALLWIVLSMVIKIVYAGRMKAEVKAAEARETADSESLKRQVVEARMAAMQAQVEPHFLFNTLASIDHLIETDPARASQMQKNLIALLRASMPGMREAATNLGREMAVVRPYLEILRVRMGERLQTEIGVSDGLHSADFPPMMLQSLVENAIKHGLEPKPEGGTLAVSAEVVDGRLEVTVADTGVGFAQAPTAGTGVGLANIRERLKLLYGSDGELRIAENTPSGTRVTIVVPYRTAGRESRGS